MKIMEFHLNSDIIVELKFYQKQTVEHIAERVVCACIFNTDRSFCEKSYHITLVACWIVVMAWSDLLLQNIGNVFLISMETQYFTYENKREN